MEPKAQTARNSDPECRQSKQVPLLWSLQKLHPPAIQILCLYSPANQKTVVIKGKELKQLVSNNALRRPHEAARGPTRPLEAPQDQHNHTDVWKLWLEISTTALAAPSRLIKQSHLDFLQLGETKPLLVCRRIQTYSFIIKSWTTCFQPSQILFYSSQLH